MTKQEAAIILENSRITANEDFSVSQEVLTAAYIEALATLYEAAEDKDPVIKAYETIRQNCRSRHQTCEGCPLYAPKDRYQPSGIPATKCLATQGTEYNIPPAGWPDPEGGGED